MNTENTTIVERRQPPQLFDADLLRLYPSLMRAKKTASRKPDAPKKALTPFNLRAQKAFDYAKIRGKFAHLIDVAKLLSEKQQNVWNMLYKPGKLSGLTVRFAHACGVSPLWLETGAGEMILDRSSLSEHAIMLGIAWQTLHPVNQKRFRELSEAQRAEFLLQIKSTL